MNNGNAKDVWQGQAVEGGHVSIAQIRANAGKFQRKIQWRNMREYVAALAVVIFFGFQFSRTDDALIRAGFGLTIVGMVYVVWQLHARGSAKALPEDAGLSSGIEFQRRELERQRDLVSSVWRWYLGPMIPGLAVLVYAMGRSNPGHLPHPELITALCAAVIGAVFAVVAWLNRLAARRLQQMIDQLAELGR